MARVNWKFRHHWTSRMLRRHLHGRGGGGFGWRPVIWLRIPMCALPSLLEPRPNGACWRTSDDDLPWPPPAWLIFHDQAAMERWREATNKERLGYPLMPATWKYEDLWPEGAWLYVELSAYSDNKLPPLGAVATALNTAARAGIRIGVGC